MLFVEFYISLVDWLGSGGDEAKFRELLIPGQGSEELPKERCDRSKERDFFLDQPRSKGGQSLFLYRKWIEGCAIQQGAEDVQHRSDKGGRMEQSCSVILANMVAVRVSHDVMKHVAMILENSLWLPGRAGSVDDIGISIRRQR